VTEGRVPIKIEKGRPEVSEAGALIKKEDLEYLRPVPREKMEDLEYLRPNILIKRRPKTQIKK
jgi:hypothetical protein